MEESAHQQSQKYASGHSVKNVGGTNLQYIEFTSTVKEDIFLLEVKRKI